MRYFIFEGALRERYDELEEKELVETDRQRDVMHQRGVKGYRVRDGAVVALLFDDGGKRLHIWDVCRGCMDFPIKKVTLKQKVWELLGI